MRAYAGVARPIGPTGPVMFISFKKESTSHNQEASGRSRGVVQLDETESDGGSLP